MVEVRRDELAGEDAGEHLRGVGDEGDRGVVLGEAHLDGERAAGGDQAVHAPDMVDAAAVERGDHPQPVVEQVGPCPGRAGHLPARHRVPAHQSYRVGSGRDGLEDDALLDGGHVGEGRVGPALGRRGEDGGGPAGRHGHDDDDRHVAVVELPAGTRVAGDRAGGRG